VRTTYDELIIFRLFFIKRCYADDIKEDNEEAHITNAGIKRGLGALTYTE
jgi:hypothetical protein